MTLARITAINLLGLQGQPIEIEVDVSNGLPSYSLLGLPDATLNESRDRIRAAIQNSNRDWPNRRITVSLSPAWLPKSGSAFDLSIALAILVASNQLDPHRIESAFFLGELSLDGTLRPIRGVLPTLIATKNLGIKRVVVPVENLQEARLLKELDVVGLPNLPAVLSFLETGSRFESQPFLEPQDHSSKLDMSEVSGHQSAKQALAIAAAGGHNVLMIGSPGSGKTMLAERFPSILPPLEPNQAIEVAGIHSIAGTLDKRTPLSEQPPFIAPHHSMTIPALVGGGSKVIRPGACSLAHHGVLFIDEAPECDSGILDSLRQPLESGEITIARSAFSATFPARFLLLLAANPCPCGKFSGRGRACECSSIQIRRYLGKLSGPLIDRIDLRIRIESPTRSELNESTPLNSSQLQERVINSRRQAHERFIEFDFKLNSQIPPDLLRNRFKPEKAGLLLLHRLLDQESISIRGFHRAIRLAWSVADIEGASLPGKEHVERALELRAGLVGE